MSRRGKAKFFDDGILVVDKPKGPTSHDVVAGLRRRYRPGKLGHAGTLDPFATGVLVLMFNRATRLAELFGSGEKVYRGVVSLGRRTDTGDPTGEVVQSAEVPGLSGEAIEAALESLVGESMQRPPAFSAAKHNGKPLYAYARKGAKVEKPAKPIKVYECRLHGFGPREIDFELRCSRGTYVRSLAEDLARRLGTVGHLAELRRLASSPFDQTEAMSLEEALGLGPQGLASGLIGLGDALAKCGLAMMEMDEDKCWQLRQGRILRPEAFLGDGGAGLSSGQAFGVISPRGGLVAVLRWREKDRARPGQSYETIRVFPENREKGKFGDRASASAMGAE